MSDESCQEVQSTPAHLELSALENLEMAFYLIREALSQLPYVTYISLMLSLVFLFLFIKPYFFP